MTPQPLSPADGHLWSRLWPTGEDAPSELVEALRAASHTRVLAHHERLYRRGDTADALFGVLRGMIRQQAPRLDGRDILVGLLPAGTWFGEISLFDDDIRPFDAIADGETTILSVAGARFRAILDARPDWYKPFTRVLCHKLRLAFGAYEAVVTQPLGVRLAGRLVDLLAEYGRDTADGRLLMLGLSQQDFADMLGATRQSVNREFQAMTTAGVLDRRRGRLLVRDVAGLARVAQGEPPPAIPHRADLGHPGALLTQVASRSAYS